MKLYIIFRKYANVKKRSLFLKKGLTDDSIRSIIRLARLVRGSIAQLGEHMPYKHGVTGSSPVVPTNVAE